MFRSRERPIVIPQWEHQKLAGTLALLWGNADFERPPVPFESFVLGVAMHDRAYGPLDDLPIGGISEHNWLDLTRRGFAMTWDDPVADAIARLHLQRLTSYGQTPVRQALAAEMAQNIREQLQRAGLDATTFARIDRITNLCDRIAFDACFEAPSDGEVAIFPRFGEDTTRAVGYRIADGTIVVTPWPFGVEQHSGYMVGYRREGYPANLEPLIVPYRLARQHGHA